MTSTTEPSPAAAWPDLSAAREIALLNTAYTRSRVLHSAVEIGLFELLAGGTATAETICQALGLHPRLVRDFLDALVGLGLLDRDGEQYANGPDAAAFLVPGGTDYLGGGVARAATHNYAMWGRLTEALRDGEPKSAGIAGPQAFATTYQDPAATRRFLAHMDANNSFVGPALAGCLDWSGVHSFVDLGGARGNVAAALVAAHPHLRGVVFDLPGMREFFDEHMAALGTADRVTFRAGDFFADPLPGTDVAIFGHVLHDWPAETRAQLLARAFRAVRPGGYLVVYDQMIDDDRRDPGKLLQSLNVRLVRAGGSEFTVGELRGWAEEAGFTFERATPVPTLSADVVAVARRPEATR